MKNLTILFLLISTLSFSQIDDEIKYLQTHNPKWFSNTPGQELRKVTSHLYSGFVISLAGGIIVSNNIGPDASPIFEKIGWGTMLIGSILMLESNRHIYRAGIILDSRGVGVTIPIGK